jgi:hypothetical protein
MRTDQPIAEAMNCICPYFTMFPLTFPKKVLERHARRHQRVLDPFCGRGTTNFAARLLSMETLGVDSNPVAAAVTAAKLSFATTTSVVRTAREILEEWPSAQTPVGEFWELAYDRAVLEELCRLREGLLNRCDSASRKVLRGIVLGALHGPLQKTVPGYFSNQCTRTYSPKPAYAVRYWRIHRLRPPKVDVLKLIERRANRFLAQPLPSKWAKALCGDSRDPTVLLQGSGRRSFDWVITSPPYYGMRTYMQDQWLRNWFLGGPDNVDYGHVGQVEHASPKAFSEQLRQVWQNAAAVCRQGARLVVRFGGIGDRKADPLDIIKSSLRDSGWQMKTIHSAGRADVGKRQAVSFLRKCSRPLEEYDIWACLA